MNRGGKEEGQTDDTGGTASLVREYGNIML